ncbi:MAG: hypothetical protein FJ291_06465 [Planctomycetes bacterium]|nr:hypothetical protein [Planctomycetota bacterium]
MIWKLSRPKPALPSSYFWTWDHSTNWVLDDPGLVTFGCDNRYLKRPETFVEDYRRLTDVAAGLGVKGIVIWGFLRDAHGGAESAKRVADYAASRGVAIKPGVGTAWYGGVYYEGDHRYNIETFLRRNPEARMVNELGEPQARGACSTHPAFLDWLQEGVRWLFREFAIGGANIENGDFLVCHDARCRAHKANWPRDDPDFFRLQALSYRPALQSVEGVLGKKLVTWATYTGFLPGKAPQGTGMGLHTECERPALLDRLPPAGITQWTLTHMVLDKPLPLTAYLDEGAPRAAFENPNWPAPLRAPAPRNVGFIHQASQWSRVGRYDQIVSTIKEACLRAHRAGMEGVSIHGEVSSRHIPWALNYLAFSHFIHWPEDPLRAFGRKTLGQVLGGEDAGERFAELLAHWDAGTLTDAHKDEAGRRAAELARRVAAGDGLVQWRFWDWLARMARGTRERHTASFF